MKTTATNKKDEKPAKKTTSSAKKTTTTAKSTTKTAAAKTAAASAKGKVKAKASAAEELKELFEDALKDIYWAEKALTKALPKMHKNATSAKLKDGLAEHLTQTEQQVKRLEEVFRLMGKKAVAKKCDAMDGLIEEGKSIMEETTVGAVRDAGIIAAAQKIEHYEIASYGTLVAWAETLGEQEIADLLEVTLNEEKNADQTLSDAAYNDINFEAMNDSN